MGIAVFCKSAALQLANEARAVAEEKLLAEQETRQHAEREVEALRAELARLRGGP